MVYRSSTTEMLPIELNFLSPGLLNWSTIFKSFSTQVFLSGRGNCLFCPPCVSASKFITNLYTCNITATVRGNGANGPSSFFNGSSRSKSYYCAGRGCRHNFSIRHVKSKEKGESLCHYLISLTYSMDSITTFIVICK